MLKLFFPLSKTALRLWPYVYVLLNDLEMSLKLIKPNMCFFPIAHLDFSFPLSYQSVNSFFSKCEVNRGSDGKTSANLRISGIASLKRRLIQCKISFLSSPRGSQVSEGNCRNLYFLSSLMSHNQLTLKGSC